MILISSLAHLQDSAYYFWFLSMFITIKLAIYNVTKDTHEPTEACFKHLITKVLDFPGGPVVKNLPCKAGDMGSIHGPRRSHMPRGN